MRMCECGTPMILEPEWGEYWFCPECGVKEWCDRPWWSATLMWMRLSRLKGMGWIRVVVPGIDEEMQWREEQERKE